MWAELELAQKAKDEDDELASIALAASIGGSSPELDEKVKLKRDKDIKRAATPTTGQPRTRLRKRTGGAPFSGAKQVARRKREKDRQQTIDDAVVDKQESTPGAPESVSSDDDDLEDEDGDGAAAAAESSDSLRSSPKKRPPRASDGSDRSGPGGASTYEQA